MNGWMNENVSDWVKETTEWKDWMNDKWCERAVDEYNGRPNSICING